MTPEEKKRWAKCLIDCGCDFQKAQALYERRSAAQDSEIPEWLRDVVGDFPGKGGAL